MKKLFLLVTIAATSIFTFAQDIIVTKDSKKIEAKIIEVSKSEIKYKEFDYQDGPTFTLDVTDINSIIYANGKVALYNQEKTKEEPQKSVQEQITQNEIKQQMIADFDIKPTSDPLMYRFINLTSDVTDCRWDFGDGRFSFAKDEAMYTFEKAGTYTITLTANVGGHQYIQRKILEVEEGAQQEQQELQEHLNQQLVESGAKLGEAIGNYIQAKNSYALDIKNNTKHPYRINLDGHILGVVNPYKTKRFIVSVEIYGRMQAVQTSGYVFSPTIKEYKIPRQQKQTAYTVVIK